MGLASQPGNLPIAQPAAIVPCENILRRTFHQARGLKVNGRRPPPAQRHYRPSMSREDHVRGVGESSRCVGQLFVNDLRMGQEPAYNQAGRVLPLAHLLIAACARRTGVGS